MRKFRFAYLLASAALLVLALPQALWATNPQSGQQNQQQRQQDEQQATSSNAQDEQQTDTLNGQVLTYREVNINGTTHFRARVQTGKDSVESVDFGPSDRNQDLINSVEQGDHVRVEGQAQKINGKTVFVASRAQLNGKSYELSEAAGEPTARSSEQENQTGQTNARQHQGNATPGARQPEAEILLDQRFVFVNEGNLNRHLVLAKLDSNAGDTQGAAGELRVAADRLSLYANSAQERGEARTALESSRQELEKLAAQINRSGKSQQSTDLDPAAARAQLAMAKFFDEQLPNHRQQPIEYGYDLRAAATHTRDAVLWSGQTPPSHTMRSIRQAMQTADELISTQQQPQNATQVAQDLQRQISQIDREVGETENAQPASARQQPDQQEQQEKGSQPRNNNSERSDQSSDRVTE
jgi:hypothetical protein